RAAKITDFKGKSKSDLDIVAPSGSPADRILVLGIGERKERDQQFWIKLGGRICAAVKSAKKVTIWLDMEDGKAKAEEAAALGLGILLRAYRFDRYKTKQDDDNGKPVNVRFTIVASAATTAKREFE